MNKRVSLTIIIVSLCASSVLFAGPVGDTSLQANQPVKAQTEAQKRESEKQLLLKVLVSAHNLNFGKDVVLGQPIKPEDSGKWDQVLDRIRPFIDTNASDLNDKFQVLFTASSQLFYVLKTLYSTQFKKASFDVDMVQQALNKLRVQQDAIQKVLADVTKKPTFERDRHKDARTILNSLALYLDATYSKVFRDWKKMVPATFVTAQ